MTPSSPIFRPIRSTSSSTPTSPLISSKIIKTQTFIANCRNTGHIDPEEARDILTPLPSQDDLLELILDLHSVVPLEELDILIQPFLFNQITPGFRFLSVLQKNLPPEIIEWLAQKYLASSPPKEAFLIILPKILALFASEKIVLLFIESFLAKKPSSKEILEMLKISCYYHRPGTKSLSYPTVMESLWNAFQKSHPSIKESVDAESLFIEPIQLVKNFLAKKFSKEEFIYLLQVLRKKESIQTDALKLLSPFLIEFLKSEIGSLLKAPTLSALISSLPLSFLFYLYLWWQTDSFKEHPDYETPKFRRYITEILYSVEQSQEYAEIATEIVKIAGKHPSIEASSLCLEDLLFQKKFLQIDSLSREELLLFWKEKIWQEWIYDQSIVLSSKLQTHSGPIEWQLRRILRYLVPSKSPISSSTKYGDPIPLSEMSLVSRECDMLFQSNPEKLATLLVKERQNNELNPWREFLKQDPEVQKKIEAAQKPFLLFFNGENLNLKPEQQEFLRQYQNKIGTIQPLTSKSTHFFNFLETLEYQKVTVEALTSSKTS
jgi:hypothetical protein